MTSRDLRILLRGMVIREKKVNCCVDICETESVAEEKGDPHSVIWFWVYIPLITAALQFGRSGLFVFLLPSLGFFFLKFFRCLRKNVIIKFVSV
jgi:hypothetical protein